MKWLDGKQLRRAAECNTPGLVLTICVTQAHKNFAPRLDQTVQQQIIQGLKVTFICEDFFMLCEMF